MPEPKRKWYAVKRLQGLALMIAGIGLLFIPITAPVAGTVIAVGASWTGVGAVAKMVRMDK